MPARQLDLEGSAVPPADGWLSDEGAVQAASCASTAWRSAWLHAPSRMYREHHTSHEQQLICVGDSLGQTGPGSCQQVAEPCLPPLDGQALDTRSLPASDATSLPSSATLGVGKQWGYSGDELRADRYRFKSQLCH